MANFRLRAAGLSLCLLLIAPPALAFKRLKAGDVLADFALSRPTGEVFRLSESMGRRATVLLFWASWSPRSRVALADLEALHAEHRDRGLTVLAINVDTNPEVGKPTAWPPWSEVACTRASDRDLAVYDALGVVAIPSLILADASREVVTLQAGYAPASREMFRQSVREAVGGEDPATQQGTGGTARRGRTIGGMADRDGGEGAPGVESVEELTRAVAKDPEDLEACLRLARTLRTMGRQDEATRVEAQVAHLQGYCLVRPRTRISATP